ncbi:hypothetical protein AB9M62_21565 [Bacillales bacterium AN1005]
MTYKEDTINDIVAKNIKTYIEAVGKSQKWVYEKSSISKAAFYKLLRGEGDLNRTVPKLNKLFRIQDPFYFYSTDFVPPRTITQIKENSSIQNQMAASYHGEVNDPDFKRTMNMLEDFISMIDVLETMKKVTTE